MSSARRPLSRSSTTTTIASDDDASISDDASNEVPYARRRASNNQLQALHKVFVTKPYPTREERNELANEIGMEYKAVTIWFQNKRQSSKRKAWTKNSRAKKRAEARQPATPARPAAPLKSIVSLDRIASLSEKPVYNPPYSPSTPLPPLTPRKTSGRVAFGTVTPQSRSDLWKYMPSSPPDHPSSPYADFLPTSALPSKSKSLEWACAKARLDHKQPRGKENRPPKPVPSGRRAKRRPTVTNSAHMDDTDVKAKMKSTEAVVPGTSRLSRYSSVRDESTLSPRTVSSRSDPPEEFEAAMILLQLGWKGKD